MQSGAGGSQGGEAEMVQSDGFGRIACAGNGVFSSEEFSREMVDHCAKSLQDCENHGGDRFCRGFCARRSIVLQDPVSLL
jgi:hypothetical protein